MTLALLIVASTDTVMNAVILWVVAGRERGKHKEAKT